MQSQDSRKQDHCPGIYGKGYGHHEAEDRQCFDVPPRRPKREVVVKNVTDGSCDYESDRGGVHRIETEKFSQHNQHTVVPYGSA